VTEGHTTDIFVVGGACFAVRGTPAEVEATLLDAARGSLMEFAWLIEDESGQSLGVNPQHVVALRLRSV
jgi:hypothetical protein